MRGDPRFAEVIAVNTSGRITVQFRFIELAQYQSPRELGEYYTVPRMSVVLWIGETLRSSNGFVDELTLKGGETWHLV